jgi:hypothetical protein
MADELVERVRQMVFHSEWCLLAAYRQEGQWHLWESSIVVPP